MLGPQYSYADELATPSELGIGRGGSFNQIMRSVAGINYYVDAIGFGQATGLAKQQGMNQSPLGIRFFTKTGQTCSNGADMYEYISTVPPGLPGRVGGEIKKTLGVDLRGMGPGIVSDAASALNPEPYFQSVIGSGYPQCKKVTLPVGDLKGDLSSRVSKDKNGQPVVWIPERVERINGVPHQTRWVFDKYISMEEYDKTPKTAAAVEGFEGASSKVTAGVLFAALALGVMTWVSSKRA
jgi:hypothetical protein